jgi:hypothetical protein
MICPRSAGHSPSLDLYRFFSGVDYRMVTVIAPRFHLDKCNSEDEREFIEAMHLRSESDGWYPDAWVWDDRVVVALCPGDDTPGYQLLLRTLRVDFKGLEITFGEDETHQFATELDPSKSGVVALTGLSIIEMANVAADWLLKEYRRPMVRQEWDRHDRRGVAPRRWVLADTGEAVAIRGLRTADFGPPDRVIHVHG